MHTPTATPPPTSTGLCPGHRSEHRLRGDRGVYGWKINSLALLADAGHNLSDVAGLVLAWGGALVSAGVVVAGALTLWMGWVWLDPVVSLLIAAVSLVGTWNLFRQSLHLLFDGVPDSVDPQAMHDYLLSLPGISRVHDLHIWAMGTSEVALTAHLVTPSGHADDGFLEGATDQLHERFDITHTTLQVVNVPFTKACGE